MAKRIENAVVDEIAICLFPALPANKRKIGLKKTGGDIMSKTMEVSKELAELVEWIADPSNEAEIQKKAAEVCEGMDSASALAAGVAMRLLKKAGVSQDKAALLFGFVYPSESKPSDEPDLAEVPADQQPLVKAILEKHKEALAKAQKEAEEAKEALALERLAKSVNEELAYLPGKREDLVSELRKLEKAELLEGIKPFLKAASNLIKESEYLKEKGSNLNGADPVETAKALAKEKVEKGATWGAAYEQVYKEHPELYIQYEKDRGREL